MEGTPTIRVEQTGTHVVVILNRPRQHNALNTVMRDELVSVLRALAADPDGPSIAMRGEGASFCSGGDLNEFGVTPHGAAGHLVRLGRHLPSLVAGLSARLTVGVHGACIGAGLELAAFAHRVVASEDAVFSLPEVQMGLLPGSGGTVSVPHRIGRQRALWLMVTGHTVDAETALAWGLVDEVLPLPQLRQRLGAEHRS